MDRMKCRRGEIRKFIGQSENILNLSTNDLGGLLGLSGRTIRDWKREKYYPSKNHIEELSKLSRIPLPSHESILHGWHLKEASRKGGQRRYHLYGPLGTKESRSKGGFISWLRRKEDPDLLKKYLNTFRKPRESKDLAELVGILLGDGGLTRGQCIIYLNSDTDQKLASYVKLLFQKLFDLTPSVYRQKRTKMIKVSISSVNLIKYLLGIGLHVGNKVHLQVGVPKWIQGNQIYTKACIRGLVDTDGCFAIHRYRVNGKIYMYPKMIFSNRSIPILNFVHQGLADAGYSPKIFRNKHVWLYNQYEVRRYLEDIGTRNYKPVVKKILGGVA